MQKNEYHFQSVSPPPAHLIFRSICDQQVSVAIAVQVDRPTDGRTDRMPILMRLRVAVIRAAAAPSFICA